MLAAVAVFALVYALLAVPSLPALASRFRTPGRRRVAALALSRPGIAALGALAVVALGAVAPREAWDAIDWRTLALLLGMMLLVAALDRANAFAVLASRMARALPTPTRLLVGSMVVVAVLAALVLNDAVVLLFTPVLVRAARAMDVSPFPFLAGEAIAANLGSAATPVGNPQNAAIALARSISFVEFASVLAPVALAGL
ncbi:MAG TPA: SLC13 family permease, partial [Candidatus Thermoplasmatota archaeon]|nr:SLC13 family permease [Candidatus Thermoplasmatota archaeon]